MQQLEFVTRCHIIKSLSHYFRSTFTAYIIYFCILHLVMFSYKKDSLMTTSVCFFFQHPDDMFRLIARVVVAHRVAH